MAKIFYYNAILGIQLWEKGRVFGVIIEKKDLFNNYTNSSD